MPTTTLYLVRHGEADESLADDPGLTELGRAQANAVGVRLREIPAASVHHSSRQRASETAAIVAGHMGTVEPVMARSAEDLTPYPDNWDLVPNRYHDWFLQVPDEERDVGGGRLDAAVAELGKVDTGDQTRIVITHNFVVGWFVRHVLEAPWWSWMGLNTANGGFSIIRWENNDPPHLLTFNETGHLEGLWPRECQ